MQSVIPENNNNSKINLNQPDTNQMSKLARFTLGDRVQLIPYKHKGKQGVIKFIGEIEGKASGNWVGVELDKPEGECHGNVADNYIFECKIGHGIFLRPTQLKLLENPQAAKVSQDPSSIMKVDESLISGVEKVKDYFNSPDESVTSNILSALTKKEEVQGQQNIIKKSPSRQSESQTVTADAQQNSQASSSILDAGRVKGWKERLELLRQEKEKERKHQQEQSQQITSAGYDASLDKNETTIDRSMAAHSSKMSEMSNLFAPAPGIQRGVNGKFNIEKEKIIHEKRKHDYEQKEDFVGKELEATKKNSQQSSVIKEAEKSLKHQTDSSKSTIGRSSLTGSSKFGAQGSKKQLLNSNKNATSTPDKRRELTAKNTAIQQKLGDKQSQNFNKRQGHSAMAGIPKPSNSRLGLSSQAANRTSNMNSSRTVSTRYSHNRKSNIDKEMPEDLSDEKSKPLSEKNTSGVLGTSASREMKQIEQIGGENKMANSDHKQDDLQLQSDGVYSSSQRTLGVDSDLTTIKKKDLQDLRDELDNLKDELQRINLELTTNERERQQLIAEHQLEIQKARQNAEEEVKKSKDNLLVEENSNQVDPEQLAEKQKIIDESEQKLKDSERRLTESEERLKKLEEENTRLQEEKQQVEEDLKNKIDQMIQAHTQSQSQLKEEQATAMADLRAENVEKDRIIEELKTAKAEEMKNEQQEIQQLKSECQEKDKEIKELKTRAEQLNHEQELSQFRTESQEKDNVIQELKIQVEGQRIDLEANQIEIELLKDEKVDLVEQMAQETARKVAKEDEEDVLDALNREELKQQNYRLRVALTNLTENFAIEREKLEQKAKDDDGKKKLIAEYEKKLEDLDVLLDELDRKEDDIAELKMENEACLEYETMVEEMAHEILKREEDNKKHEKKIESLYNMITLHEEYTENLEQYNEEIHHELSEKDAIISKLEQLRKDDEELLLDVEDENQKYRQKVHQLSKAIRDLTSQLQAHSQTPEQKSQVQLMIEKQNSLIQQIKEQEKQNVDSQLKQIDFHWQTSIRIKIIESIVPKRLMGSVQMKSLEKLNILNQSSCRAMYMIRYICEKQMPNVHNLYEVSSQDDEEEMETSLANKLNFLKLMINICVKIVFFIDYSQRIILCVSNMSVDQYKRVTDDEFAPAHFQQIHKINQEMANILEKLKNENIGLKYDLSALDQHIRKVQELKFLVQKVFLEKSKEEIAAEKSDFGFGDQQILIDQQVRQRQTLIDDCQKLDLRHQALMMTYQVIALQTFVGEILSKHKGHKSEEMFWKKCPLIYGRLYDMVFKLDHVPVQSAGEQFLCLQELSTDKHLKEKYDAIKEVWVDNDLKIDDILRKDWNSILDAIQKDISHQFNDYRFKQLVQQVDATYNQKGAEQPQSVGIDQLFFLDEKYHHESLPWNQIAAQISVEIENSGQLKDKIGELMNKNTQLMKLNIQNDNEVRILKTTKTSLEQRLTAAQTQIEQLNYLQNDLQVSKKKCQATEKQNTDLLKKVEHVKEKYKELKKKNEELQNQIMNGPIEPMNNQSSKNLGNRPSIAQNFFQRYRTIRESGAGNRANQRELNKYNDEKFRLPNCLLTKTISAQEDKQFRREQHNQSTAQLIELLQNQEDTFLQIIYNLQRDRVRLRGQDLTTRLSALSKSNGAFNEMAKLQSQKNIIKLSLSDQEEGALVKAVEKVSTLQQHARISMASVKVPNLQQRQEQKIDLQKKKRKGEKESRSSLLKKLNWKEKEADINKLENFEGIQSDVKRSNMNISWMVSEAREEVNAAIDQLISKQDDSGILKIKRMARQVEEDWGKDSRNQEEQLFDNNNNRYSTQNKRKQQVAGNSRIPIGSIMLGSDNKVDKAANQDESQPAVKHQRNVVFSVKSIRALQNNLGVLSV